MPHLNQLTGKAEAVFDGNIGIVLNTDGALCDNIMPCRLRLSDSPGDAGKAAGIIHAVKVLQNIHPHGGVFKHHGSDNIIGLRFIAKEEITSDQC